VHAVPAADPNVVWTGITREYLHIQPHPDLSWWAMRGQLVDAPGYLINYALGAFMAADIRARVRQEWRPLATAGPLLYPWLSDRLYRFGRERPARAVLEQFLGRPMRPDALLQDLARMRR
jgi:Zn-dependent M32 family carboxypeptidase